MSAPSTPRVPATPRERLAAWEVGFVARYGRKFALACFAIAVGFVVHVLGMRAVTAVEVERAREITEIVKAFRDVLVVGVACFTGADMLITRAFAQQDPAKAGPGPNRSSGMVAAQEAP
jgi:hypothetical protein